jgi:hypothetical protein
VDLRTGSHRTATLTVPVAGDVPEPKSNFTIEHERLTTHGPYLLGVTALRLDADRLTVTLGSAGVCA